MAGVTDSPNLAIGFGGAVIFFSNNFRRSLMGSIAGSGVRWDDGDDGLSNRFLFSIRLRRDAVSVITSSWVTRLTDCDVIFGGDLVTGVTVTVFSVRQVLAATSGFSLSGDALRAMDDKQFVSPLKFNYPLFHFHRSHNKYCKTKLAGTGKNLL